MRVKNNVFKIGGNLNMDWVLDDTRLLLLILFGVTMALWPSKKMFIFCINGHGFT